MLLAPDWHKDTEERYPGEPLLTRALFARWALELLARGEQEQALARAEAGTQSHPDYATGWFVLAKVQMATELCRDAVRALERCLGIEPSFFAAWDLLAVAWDRLQRPAAARAARARYAELLGAFAPPPAPPVRSPEAPVGTGAPSRDAEPRRLVFRRPLEVARAFETPTLAEVYRRQGLLDRALEVYTRILDRHPEDAGARVMVEKLQTELAARRKPVEQPT